MSLLELAERFVLVDPYTLTLESSRSSLLRQRCRRTWSCRPCSGRCFSKPAGLYTLRRRRAIPGRSWRRRAFLCSSSAWCMHSHTSAAPMSDEVLPAHDTAEEPADHTDQIQVQAPYRNVGDLDATWLGSVSPCSSAGRDALPSSWPAWDRSSTHPSSP